MNQVPIVAIIGPTAVGKSAMGIHLAAAFEGEVVNSDSRQVYRSMDIGTAKPSAEDRSRVPHHLIDILDPDQDFSLALFLQIARSAVQDIQTRGKLPILVGGTGQYVWAFLEGWQVPQVPPDPDLRKSLEKEASLEGSETLYKRLQEVDPQAASRIDPRNLRRVIRALEVYQAAGTAPSNQKDEPRLSSLILGLTTDRRGLYDLIDTRVDQMLANGLVEEVQALMDKGYSPDLPSMSGMGYKEIAQHLQGDLTLEDAVQRIKHETHRFARHQYTWFRLSDKRINWLDGGPYSTARASTLVDEFLSGDGSHDTIASATESQSK